MLHISVKGEVIGYIAGFPITNSLLLSLFVLVGFSLYAYQYQTMIFRNASSSFVFYTRFFTTSLYGLFEPILGKKTRTFFPLLATFFLFILLSNWLGLVPGVGSITIAIGEHESIPLLRAATADLNTTLALALISFVLIQFYGITYVGIIPYLKKFINLSNPIAFFTGILEIISEFSKIISFAFRLFGNIFAGEVLLTIIAFLIPVLASFPFLLLEVFVGVVQALVFSMLTAVFLHVATTAHAH